MKTKIFKIIGSFVTILASIQSLGVLANNADIDPSFDTGTPMGFDDSVAIIKTQTDGKIIVGGYFNTYQGFETKGITRIYSDGSRDTSFVVGDGFDDSVRSLSIQNDGKIIVGGAFTTYQGNPVNKIVRLNTGGSIDNSFVVGDGFDNAISSLAIQNNGKIIVGGYFSNYQGTSANRIIRLNNDGSIDESFAIGDGFNGLVSSILIQSDGKIVVGGAFTMYQGNPVNRIIRLNSDGSIDNSFVVGDGFNDTVDSLAIQSDGKIILVGNFSSYQGTTVNSIVCLNIDGSIDDSFIIGDGFDSTASSLAIQEDGKIIIGGTFSSYQGISANGIVRLNTGGSIDNSFNENLGFDKGVGSITLQTNNKILISQAEVITRLNSDGSIDNSLTLGNGFDRAIWESALDNNGKLLIGGDFTQYKGNTANNILRVNINGDRDDSFNIGAGFDSAVYAIAPQTDGKIVVGGDFTTYQNIENNYITRLNTNGSIDNSFSVEAGFDSSVSSLSVQSDGKIVVGGAFTTYQGNPVNRIVRLNSDGSIDNSFVVGDGFNDMIFSLIIQNNGKIVVGGAFTSYQGTPVNGIARLNSDGSIDNSFVVGDGFDNMMGSSLAIQSDGKIVVGGAFTTYQGNSVNGIVRLNSDGSIDNSFVVGDGFNNTVDSLAIQSDGKIVVGGAFTTYQGTSANGIALLNTDGSIDNSFVVGDGFDDSVRTLSIQSDGKIVVAGQFNSYKHSVAGYLTRLYGNADVVMIPNSTDTGTVNDAFTDEGYTLEPGGDLIGDLPMSLMATDGTIPVDLSIRNADITMSLEADSQILGSDSTNYDGILAVPVPRDIESVNDTPVLTAFKVGAISESLTIDEGAITLSVPVPSEEIGQYIQVYNAQDNGVSWYPKTIAQVIDKNGVPTVEFSTNQFGDFAITQAPDTTAPIGTISYSTTGSTSSDVVATLSLNETATITNNNGNTSYTFTGNGEFIFTFEDTAGNTGSTTATVNWINKNPSSNGGGGGSGSPSVSNLATTILEESLHIDALYKVGSIQNSPYSEELNNAYLWAYKMGITTMPSIQQANIDGKLIRSHLAKMISEYAVKQLKKTANTGAKCEFSDMNNQSTEMKVYAQAACQLGLMGLKSDGTPNTKFNPTAEVTRAQFGTTLSRLLYGASNNEVVGGERYTAHLNALKKAGIMTKIETPTMNELRGNVFLMLMRTVK